MKAVMIVLLIFVAACMILPAATSGGSGQMSGLGAEKPQSWASGSDAKRMEDKMTEALSGLDAFKKAKTNEKEGIITGSLIGAVEGASSLNNSTSKDYRLDNSTLSNSTEQNSTGLNSSAVNSSALNSSANDALPGINPRSAPSPAGTLSSNISADSQGVGSSSEASFNGYYGITASRHEMGKSDIKSSTFLSGGFNVDKTVQFSDRGF
jgi:hypothetical protein